MQQVIHGDCIEHLPRFRGEVDLVFADPPYNIGYKYDSYDDNRSYEDYVTWTRRWIRESSLTLTPTGSAFFMIGDEFAAETRLAIRDADLILRNWIIWNYSFGQHRPDKFGRSHVHLFYAVKDPKRFTFNDIALRVPSRRGLVYNDRRTDPRGRLPEDTWASYPRVCGTFRARQDWHGCQLPEDLLARIITGASNPGDLVLDPFSGSGTTLAVAKRFNRRFLGIELSSEYVEQAKQRLAAVDVELVTQEGGWPTLHIRELLRFYRETNYPLSAFAHLAASREHFVSVFNRRLGTVYSWQQVHFQLMSQRSRGGLPVIDPVDTDDEEQNAMFLRS